MANNIKGITLEIGGDTTSLQKALKDVDKSIRDTQAGLRDVDKLLKVDPSSVELLRQKQTLLNTAIDDTKKRLDTLKQAQDQMDANGVDKSSESYMGLQREIIATEQKLGSLQKEAKGLNPVLNAMAAGADKVSKKMKAASDAIAPFSKAAAGVGGALLGLGYKSITAADDLNTLAKQTGLSTDDLQKFAFASDRIDVSMDTMTGAFTKLKKNMSSTSKDTVAAFTRLGVSARDTFDGSMRPAKAVFDEVVAALGNVANETERDQLAMQIFGRSADELAGIIDDGGAALAEYGNQAEDMGLILSGDTLNSLNETNDKIDEMKAVFGASLGELGATVAEVLAPAVEKVSGFIKDIAEGLRSLSPEQVQLILTIAGVVAALAPVLAVGSKVFAGISKVLTLITTVSGFISGTLIPAVAAISAPVLAVIAVVTAIGVALVALYKKNEDFRNKVNEIWEQIKVTISMVIEMIQAIISKFVEVAQAIWAKYGDTITAAAKAAWDFIYKTISTVIGAIQTVIKAITQVIQGDWSGAWTTIKTFAASTVGNILSTVSQKVADIRDTIKEKIGEAVAYLTDLPGKAIKWGKDLISNFVDGIKRAWDDLKDTVSDVAGGIADYLGFSEPEKGPLSNFHTFAPDMMDLYAQGIRDNAHLVTDQIANLAGAVAGGMTGMATVNVTSNTFLDGRLIASAVNAELGAML